MNRRIRRENFNIKISLCHNDTVDGSKEEIFERRLQFEDFLESQSNFDIAVVNSINEKQLLRMFLQIEDDYYHKKEAAEKPLTKTISQVVNPPKE